MFLVVDGTCLPLVLESVLVHMLVLFAIFFLLKLFSLPYSYVAVDIIAVALVLAVFVSEDGDINHRYCVVY